MLRHIFLWEYEELQLQKPTSFNGNMIWQSWWKMMMIIIMKNITVQRYDPFLKFFCSSTIIFHWYSWIIFQDEKANNLDTVATIEPPLFTTATPVLSTLLPGNDSFVVTRKMTHGNNTTEDVTQSGLHSSKIGLYCGVILAAVLVVCILVSYFCKEQIAEWGCPLFVRLYAC